jgi:hypothetical chaperone protein
MERFGLDFGTTNTALAWARPGARSELVALDAPARNPQVLRSLLYYSVEARGFVVGQRAIDEYLAEDMEGTLIQSIKTFLGSESFEDTFVVDRKYRLEDLLAVLFRVVREAITRTTSPDEVVLVVGRPAVYVDKPAREELARGRVRRAAALAGLPQIAFQYEPIAAGLAYEATLTHPETALIVDLGGGTSDFTVMRLGAGHRGDRREDILATGGVQIGGDTFDARLMAHKLTPHFGAGTSYQSMEGRDLPFPAHILERLGHWHEIPFLRSARTRELLRRIRASGGDAAAVDRLQELLDGNYAFFLFEEIERAKSRLSGADRATIRFDMGAIHIEESVTRAEFEAMIGPDLDRVWQVLHGVLHAAGRTAADVDAVFVTGGSAQIPAVHDRLLATFGAERLRAQDYLTSVAVGLGVDASDPRLASWV